jgi:hypothetical protein
MQEAVNEIIWHFAGYFRLSEDIARDRLEYLDGALRLNPDDYTIPLPQFPFLAELDPFETQPLPPPTYVPVESPYVQSFAHLRGRGSDSFEEPETLPLLPAPRFGFGGGGGGGGAASVTNRDIIVRYQDGGEQLQLEIRQVNRIEDDDHLGVNPNTGVTELNDVNVAETLRGWSEASATATPPEVALPDDGAPDVVAFVKERDTETSESGGSPSEHSVEPGIYVNGELQSPDFVFELPDLSPPSDTGLPEPVRGETATLGDNTSVNAGLMIDVNEGSPTMLVLGDYFGTDAIVQTWSYSDNDDVTIGGSDLQDIVTGDNSAHNVAEFDDRPGIYPDLTGYFSGWNWDVDVVEGDYYDIRMLLQEIYLSDNDITVQETQESHYQVQTGDNQQFNLAEIFSGEIQYDLIIIGGDYHGGNYIFQHLYLLDDDVVMMGATDGEPQQTLGTGDNTLVNNATIQTYGDDTYIPLTDEARNLATALANRETSLDPEEYGFVAPGVGPGPLNVLYITGDYYDINAIWQYITVADADTALQLLDGEQALMGAPESELVQSIQTGGNTLLNDAAIVDVDPGTTLVGGGVYTDTILVQAELVTEDDDNIVHDNGDALVSELIAFIGSDDAEPTESAPSMVPQPYDDPISGVVA